MADTAVGTYTATRSVLICPLPKNQSTTDPSSSTATIPYTCPPAPATVIPLDTLVEELMLQTICVKFTSNTVRQIPGPKPERRHSALCCFIAAWHAVLIHEFLCGSLRENPGESLANDRLQFFFLMFYKAALS